MAASTNQTETSSGVKSNKDDKPVRVIKNSVDLQRLKLEKLMKNPTKEVYIPEKSKEKAPRAPLEFIRNIWGSSAGAGSGDFHVYRGVRRREYARQKFITEKAAKEELDDEYKKKLEQNKKEAEERTAKNRAKRLKKKQKMKANKKKKANCGSAKPTEQESSEEEEDDDNDEEDRSAGGDGEHKDASHTEEDHSNRISKDGNGSAEDDAGCSADS